MSFVAPRFGSLAIPLIAVIALAGCGSGSSSGGSPTATTTTSGANLSLVSPGFLTVGTDPTYPPMESADINDPSKYIGADVDLANAIAKAMGLKGAHIVKGAFDSLITSLQAKRYDVIMSSMNDTPERAKQVAFVDYMTASEGILVKQGSGIQANDYSALCGKSVSVERGTTELDGLNAANSKCSSKIAIQAYQGDSDAYQAFVSGHVVAYTSDLPVIANYVKMSKGKYVEAGKAITAGEDYGIAIRKGDTPLISAVRKAVAKVRSSGQYASILKKWGVNDAALH